MFEQLLNLLNKYNKVSIFRHQKPDGDCTFSVLALKEFLNLNFKNIEVKCLGHDVFYIYPLKEDADDNFIKDSLAIILDCSTPDRTDDQRFALAKERIVIDHHPGDASYYDYQIVDTKVSATAELLAKIFYSPTFQAFKLNENIYKFLYCGILTDSMSFSTSNTTADTLFYASKLMNDGQLKGSDLNEFVFNKSIDEYKKTTSLRNYLQTSNEGVYYAILNDRDLKNIGLSNDEAKNNVSEFSIIKEAKIWAIFAYNAKNNYYEGSIRSRRKYVINELCKQYHGGGHKNACGIKQLDLKDIEQFIEESKEIIKLTDQKNIDI